MIEEDVHVEPYAVCMQGFMAGGCPVRGRCERVCTPVIEVKRDKEALTVRTTKGTFTCDDLTVASGVWSGRFLKNSDYLILFIQ
ncbi:hypothetical protein BsIDN1_21660 [Bacillus safensis]|uniref:FAD dependent oxidoreductase domain-containing protein n=1 Tax=Bacillus safensis TaxID=561879 RepID=A0A5S9M6T2_BACIA|nr:hypothetical protein BsIDN1_21660 [Bacillus safensis]